MTLDSGLTGGPGGGPVASGVRSALCRAAGQMSNVAAAAVLQRSAGHWSVTEGSLPGARRGHPVERPDPPDWVRDALDGRPGTYTTLVEPGAEGAGPPAVLVVSVVHQRPAGETVLATLLQPGADATDCREATDHLARLAEAASLLTASDAEDWAAAEAARIDELVRRRAYTPVFQPVIDLRDHTPVGYEALTRFAAGTGPAEEFGVATRVGRGIQLELATMSAAVAAARRLPGDHWLALNISPTVLAETDLVSPLIDDLGRPVVFELTEHVPIPDYGLLHRALDRLPPTVSLSVDDAGSGFASLQHVLALRPGYIKLDRSWVAGIDADPVRQALVGALCAFADETGARLIAEGVETGTEASTLATLGVVLAQGYLFGQPAPA